MLITVIVVNIMNYLRPENIINLDYQSLIIATMGGIFGISFLQAVQIPSMYKWGAEKGRIQMFILVLIIVAMLGGIYFLINKTNINILVFTPVKIVRINFKSVVIIFKFTFYSI